MFYPTSGIADGCRVFRFSVWHRDPLIVSNIVLGEAIGWSEQQYGAMKRGQEGTMRRILDVKRKICKYKKP